MTGLTSDPVTPINRITGNNDNQNNYPSLQDRILSHMSSLETLIRQYNEKAETTITPTRLTFTEEESNKGKDKNKGPEGDKDEDLKRPYTEVLKSPFTRQIIEFSVPNHRMPANLKIYDSSADSDDHITRFVRAANQGEVDDFVNSEEAYKSTELSKGEHPKKGPGISYKGNRPPRSGYGNEHQRMDSYCRRDHYQPYVPPRAYNQRNDNCMYDNQRQKVNHLRLDALTKLPRHYTNDCYQLKRQLKATLESGKLIHLFKDVRQRRNNRGRQPGNNNGRGKVINMIWERGNSQKRKSWRNQGEDWMNVPITFPSVQTDDVSDDPLIVEAEVEGYLARLTTTQTELVGFSGEQLIPIGKVELKVTFGGGGLSLTVMLKFTVVRASSLYNIILGRTGMSELRAVSSTVHAMVKFPTPRGIATPIARTEFVYEYRWSEKKIEHDEKVEVMELENPGGSGEEKVLVNPTFPEQKVTIGTQFSAECRERLIRLLKNNMDVFTWQPSDMVGVPRRIIKHTLNVNVFVPPVAQKRRVLGIEKSRAVMKEVEEWVKAGIARPVNN
uniref:Reverse transcriptase domain-containing protein n=1 Tax=Tanacetum cinerariifolium TaxID=118510 RepID=A0A6L2P401_TANCI|nr:reverse transcriptase domain-containing protein [Tanacetum cinerariifolium]